MGWKDAPVVGEGGSGGGWQSAPVVKPAAAAGANVERGMAQVADEESNPALVQVGAAISAPFEGANQLLRNIHGKLSGSNEGEIANAEVRNRADAMKILGEQRPESRPVGTLTDVATAGVGPAVKAAQGAGWLGRAGAGAGTGAVYGGLQPEASGKDFATEKAKQVGGGAAVGGVLTGAVDAATRGPAWLKTIVDKLTSKPQLAQPGPRGTGAEKVVEETQRQRDVMEGKKEPVYGASPYDTAVSEFEGRSKALRDKAFGTGSRLDTGDTLKLLDEITAKNPDRQVQGALREVRQTLDRAIKAESAASLPASGTRMTAAQLKGLQGQQGELGLQMADEVRQSINRLIEQGGDKALSSHTKEVLAQAREKLLARAPVEYREWLATHGAGAREMDKFRPEVTVLGKTSTDKAGAAPLIGGDAQAALETAFGGKTAARDLQQLVQATGSTPAARDGLRTSYKEWLFPTDPSGAVNIKGAAQNWQQSKDAVRTSGLFDPQHFAAIDKVMNELLMAKDAAQTTKTVASGAAFLLGSLAGRGGTAAMAARQAVDRLKGAQVDTPGVERKIIDAMTNPQAAQALAAPPTPENIRRLEEFLQIGGSRAVAESKPPRPLRPHPLGMRPTGL